MKTIKKLQSLLPSEVDALLVTSEIHQRYLTGLNYTDGYVLVTHDRAWLLTDFRYIEVAKRVADEDLEVRMFDRRNDLLKRLFTEYSLKVIGYEDDSMTCAELGKMKDFFPTVSFVACGGILSRMRQIKTAEEVSYIVKAQEIAEKALDRLFPLMTPTMTELDVALELEYGMRKFGAEKPSFDTIAVSGSASSLPHGVPRNVPLEKGFLTMDFGALYNGYCSDMTRTVVIGRADDEMKRVYQTVLSAQLAALDFVAAGKTGAACDKIARDIIYGAGYEGCFGHSLGHAVGMLIHEEPRLSSVWNKELEVGNIVTVEPGIYKEGQYGVRIEDMVWLSENGTVNLTKAKKELIELF